MTAEVANRARTILIMAGGTGGHVFPALAVADWLRERGWHIVWLGTKNGMEARLVPERGYPIEYISFAGLRRSGVLRAVLLPLSLIVAFAQSVRVLLRRRPDIVLGLGGYATFPAGMMASLLNRPLAIHEQNSVAGLANRVLARVADRVMAGFPNAFVAAVNGALAKALGAPRKVEWVGNPVRHDIAQLAEPSTRYAQRSGTLRLLIVGGSQGAQALNEALPPALALIPQHARPQVTHQCGEKNREGVQANYARSGVDANVVAFLADMASQYAESDLLICRAGALTVAEIAAAGVASVLVPYPFAVDDHQTGNARFLSDAGAAVLLPQADITAQKLATLIQSFSREQLAAMAQKARALAKPDATQLVGTACMELAAA